MDPLGLLIPHFHQFINWYPVVVTMAPRALLRPLQKFQTLGSSRAAELHPSFWEDHCVT